KSEGDAVSRGDTLLELETDKVNLDVAATEDGILSAIHKNEGDVVVVGEVLGTIGEGSGSSSNGAAADHAPAAETAPAPAPAAVATSAPASTGTAKPAEESPSDAAGRAAPAVRRLAEEHNVNLGSLSGSGPGGRVTREDVMAAIQTSGAPAPAPAPAAATPPPSAPTSTAASPATTTSTETDRPQERVRMSRRRQTIAHRLVEAQQTAAMLTTFNEIDMTAVMDLRSARKEAFKERHGVNLGFMSFFTKAVVGALKAFPYVNAEIDGTDIVVKKYYDIGIAVGVEDGLVVPVVRDADRKNFAAIEQEIVDLATRAREGTLTLPELTGGTFTITNGGIYGSLMSTPILNAPQVGILGMHAIQKRPVVSGDEIVIRPMMYVALSYDHRIVDGSEAVRFLVRIKELIEDPTSLLLEG
ncbi:MAG: 2-oxoglutarate dehydrogenase complex dihydrolipoyllysine-residue succinyltransferase, partial [Thermomicrobiales bacterium]